MKDAFVHHVFFWLKNPASETDRAALVAGLQKLTAAPTIHFSHVGLPAPTDRPVVERSYSVSWLLFFKTAADEAAYQTEPIHLKFIADCQHLWEKVVVFDSIPIED